MPRISASLETRAKLFRGLADLSRLAILDALRGGPLNVSQVIDLTGLSQPSASMHLDCLRCCGLVDRERRGRFAWYRLSTAAVGRLLRSADSLLSSVEDRIEACRRYGK